MRLSEFWMAAFVSIASFAGQLSASTLYLTSTYSGSWGSQETRESACEFLCNVSDVDAGFHDASVLAPRAGYVTRPAINGFQTSRYRNFFIFDVPADLPTITNAQLFFPKMYGVNAGGLYILYDVSTPLDQLTASGTNRADICADLGSGKSYGVQDVNSTFGMMQVDLYPNAVDELNRNRGARFVLGGMVTGWGTDMATQSAGGSLYLTLVDTPEPSTALLAGIALVLVGIGRLSQRRRRR